VSGLRARGGGRYALSGELTFATVPGLWRPAGQAFDQGATVRLDLSGITRVDSAGIALLIELTRAVRRGGGEIRLEHASAQLMAIAEVSGLDQVLPFITAAGVPEK
jgi:phospholipid transport system transporter-binding protein